MNFFICPTNKVYMPYIDLYDEPAKSAFFIVWDRFNKETSSDNCAVYRDKKTGHKRNIIDYLLFSLFVIKWLTKHAKNDDNILVFGPQLVFFLWPFLLIKKNTYSIDYRDYHILTKLTPSIAFSKAKFIAVSSPSYKSLFSEKENVVISHNFKLSTDVFNYNKPSNPLVISCIGALRDFEANSELIFNLYNNNDFKLNFHGSGTAEADLKKLSNQLNAKNILFTGFYNKNDEANFYKNSAFINLLRHSDTYNDRVALPNRLYNAAQYRVPILCYRGTLLSDYVEKYNLGVCVDIGSDFALELSNYLLSLEPTDFESGVASFINDIESEQLFFVRTYSKFFNLFLDN